MTRCSASAANGREGVAEVADEPGHRVEGDTVAIEHHLQPQQLTGVDQQGDREVAGRGDLERRRSQRAGRVGGRRRVVLDDHDAVEQRLGRRHPGRTMDVGQRKVAVRTRVDRELLHRAEPWPDSLLGVDPEPDGRCRDEHAHHVLHAVHAVLATGDGGAEDDVVDIGLVGQHQAPHRRGHGAERDALLAGEGRHGPAGVGVEVDEHAIVALPGARLVELPRQRCRVLDAIEVLAPPAFRAGAVLVDQPLDVVAERPNGRPCRRIADLQRFVGLQHLAKQQVGRPAVEDGVMDVPGEVGDVGPVHQTEVHERRVACEVEAGSTLRREERVEVSVHLVGRAVPPLVLLPGQRLAAQDDLDRRVELRPPEPHPGRRVPIAHEPPGLGQAIAVDRTGERARALAEVGGRVGAPQMVVQHAGLGRRERVDVLDRGRARRAELGDDARRVVRTDPGLPRCVGRCPARIARCRIVDHAREFGDGVMGENVARGEGHAEAPGRRGDTHAGDRVAAEVEKVVVHAHFGKAQHVAPDRRQAVFGLGAGRDVGARELRGGRRPDRAGRCGRTCR